jgi:hypothetical protein
MLRASLVLPRAEIRAAGGKALRLEFGPVLTRC